jgi:hypothetical protein
VEYRRNEDTRGEGFKAAFNYEMVQSKIHEYRDNLSVLGGDKDRYRSQAHHMIKAATAMHGERKCLTE